MSLNNLQQAALTAASVKALAVSILRYIENLQLPAAADQSVIDNTHKSITSAIDQLTSMIPLLPEASSEFIPVESSNLEGVSYGSTNLDVKFKNGGVYRYHGVPRDVFESLLASNSKGQFLNAKIKPVFEFSRL